MKRKHRKQTMNNFVKKNKMFKILISLLLFIVFVSCNNSIKENDKKHASESDNINTDKKNLEEKANDYYMNKKYSEGISSYDKLISIDSNKGGYYFKRGYCKARLLKYTEARLDYLKSIELNYSQKELAYFDLGLIHRATAVFHSTNEYERITEYNTALYYYNECLKIEPNDTKALKEKKEVIEILNKFQ